MDRTVVTRIIEDFSQNRKITEMTKTLNSEEEIEITKEKLDKDFKPFLYGIISIEEEQNRKIFNLWMQCYSSREIEAKKSKAK